MIRLTICTFAIWTLASQAAAGPLHEAVENGDIAKVRQLIAEGEDVNESDSSSGTPLHQAALWGTAEMAELLLAEGADVNVTHFTLGTPLKLAALKGNDAVAATLIARGADMEVRGVNGTTPLHAAAEGGHAAVVELLVANGADVNARSFKTGESSEHAPVHSAGVNGHFDIVDLLRALGARGPTIKSVADLLASANSSDGEEVFNKACRGCHTVDEGGPSPRAPNLWGVLGRKKASVEGYSYSRAFGRLVGTWTLAEFNAYVAAPMDYIPGTNMFRGVDDPTERANLIAYLRQKSDNPPTLPATVPAK